MASFQDYIAQTAKQYKFKVKLASELKSDALARLKIALKKFDLDSISEAKRLPVTATHPGFEHLGATEIYVFEIVQNYPATPVQIQDIVVVNTGIPKNRVLVATSAADEIAAPVTPAEDEKATKGSPTLVDYEKALQGKTIEYPFAVKPSKAQPTTNDLPQGNKSPLSKAPRNVDTRKV